MEEGLIVSSPFDLVGGGFCGHLHISYGFLPHAKLVACEDDDDDDDDDDARQTP